MSPTVHSSSIGDFDCVAAGNAGVLIYLFPVPGIGFVTREGKGRHRKPEDRQ